MASKINTDWFADECATDLNSADDLTQYNTSVEREVEAKCLIEGVSIAEIPLDEDGYYSSHLLIMYAVLLFKKYLFFGYWGSSDGNQYDIYKDKLKEVKEEIRALEPKLTRESILGLATSDGEPKGKGAVMSIIGNYQGAGYGGGSCSPRNFY